MRLEVYAPRGSAVHALHPATKIALVVGLMVGPFLTQSVPAQFLALAAVLGAAASGRVLDVVLAPWKFLAFIFAITFAVWSLSEGALPSLAYAVRVTAVFILGLLFLATTRIEETIHGLQVFRVPYRVAFALGLAFRLVPLFLQSAASILEAQRSRALDLASGGLRGRLRKYVPVLVPIFMTSLRNADQMAMALDARGFGAKGPRTRLREHAHERRDVVALALGALYVAVFLAFRYHSGGAFSMVPAK